MQKIDRVLWLLTGLVVFFTALLFAAEHFFPMDGQIFQVISGLLTGFSGALLMRVKPSKSSADDPTTSVDTLKVTHTEPSPDGK